MIESKKIKFFIVGLIDVELQITPKSDYLYSSQTNSNLCKHLNQIIYKIYLRWEVLIMKGKILKNFILATCTWTVAIMVLISYASAMVSNMWISVMTLLGLVILWFLVNTFITVHFLKKNPR
ncbi:MAG: hypothetical protein H7Y18_11585 [Clostridiaceae bacterium]|nr:hypothetical protein [Clostridiaceae bacterium]